MSADRPHWWPAYVGVGSNLDSPREHVANAFQDLARLPDTLQIARSSMYVSEPLGPSDQPRYVNAVVALLTQNTPQALLDSLLQIETQHGRVRSGEKWGPRTLDLDLLVFGSEVVEEDGLTLPHPGIAERNFVLLPLCEIAPNLPVPGLGSASRLCTALPRADSGIEKLDTRCD